MMRELTDREQQVLRLVAKGMTNKEVAVELDVSVGTIRQNMYAAMSKLEAANRIEAVVKATREGLI